MWGKKAAQTPLFNLIFLRFSWPRVGGSSSVSKKCFYVFPTQQNLEKSQNNLLSFYHTKCFSSSLSYVRRSDPGSHIYRIRQHIPQPRTPISHARYLHSWNRKSAGGIKVGVGIISPRAFRKRIVRYFIHSFITSYHKDEIFWQELKHQAPN